MRDGNRHPLLYAEIDKLAKAVSAHKPFRVFTFGVFDGIRLGQMAKRVRAAGRPNVEMYGVDLFEDMTTDKNAEEIGKSTLAPSFEQAKQNANKFGAPRVLKLYKGDSVEVLPRIRHELPPMDLVFVDGGHSLQTIASDAKWAFNMCARHGSVAFDDVYPDDLTKGAWSLCQSLTALGKATKTPIRLELSPEDAMPKHPIRLAMVTAAGVHAASKLISFGFNYGIGAPAKFDLPLTPKQAAKMIDDLIEATNPQKMVDKLNDSGIKAKLGPVIHDSAVIELPKGADFGAANDALGEVMAAALDDQTRREVLLNGWTVYDETAELTPEQIEQILNFRKGPDHGTGSVDHSPDVRPVAGGAADGGDGAGEHAEQSGDGGGRREPGLEPGSDPGVGESGGPQGPADPASLPEERPQPDPQLEPGPVEGAAVVDPVRGDGEQRPEVPEGLVAAPPPVAPQMRPGPRRSNDKRPRA